MAERTERTCESPRAPLVPWVFVHHPLEHWLSDYQRTFDAWEDGGVRGIVVGRLDFFEEIPPFDFSYSYGGTTLPAFCPDPKVYASFGVTPPPERPRDLLKEQQLQGLLDDAASRGWEIMLFGYSAHGGSTPEKDPFGVASFAAGVQDAMNAFPQAHGFIIDAAGEHRYELAFQNGGELLEIRDDQKQRLAHLDVDINRVERGIAHLRDRFHRLTPDLVRYHASGGLLGALALFDLNEDVLYWLQTRQQTTLAYMAAVRRQIDGLSRKVKLGTIPRTAAFSILTTQDYQKTHPYFDYVFPKYYFWHRAFDGMYGTVARWVRRIGEWNPTLTEPDCFAVVNSWFGLELPGIASVADMENGFPDEFFSQLVYSETRRALEAIGDDTKVVGWVSTGRHPHGGDPMPAHDLHRILVASQRAGLKRFVYHPDPDLGAAEWSVISGLCGNRWKEDPDGYWPSDTPKPGTWDRGRPRISPE